MNKLLSALRASILLLLFFTLLSGAYTLAVTAVAQVVFNHKANGSLIEREGKVIGSELLGQSFTSAKYFWSRPSATVPPYNAAASAGSNLGPANPELHKRMKERLAALRKIDPSNKQLVPVSLITASASGLDPHTGWEAAHYQISRVARARGMKESEVQMLVERHTESALGVLGLARVNVLRLNLALDEMQQGGQ